MSAIIGALREASWLGAARARAWARVLVVVFALAALAMVAMTRAGSAPDPWGRPVATDFVSFWTAGRLALQGAAADAWHPVAHAAAQRAGFSPAAGYAADYYAFFYPPPFLLICLPLALLPYCLAALVWLGATTAGYVAAIRVLLPPRWPRMLAALAYPAVMINAGGGQNGALFAALLAGAALWLDRRPRLAGACLGALCCKPQLALLVVPALLAARRWQALAWAAAAAAALCLASLLALGPQAWLAFIADAALARATLEQGLVGFAKMDSGFAASRQLGAGLDLAWAIQAALSLAALLVVLDMARRRPGAGAEAATLAAAACLATPFLFDYDLMLLAVPLAWVAAEADRGGFRPWEKLVLAAAFLLPLVARSLAMQAGLPVAPLVVAALLGMVVRRARSPVQAAALMRA